MNNFQKDIGKRLKELRSIYNSGFKASVEQFASELGETRHNISNYESGKASIPNRVLAALYEKGLNPVYLLTGEGSKFSQTKAGMELKIKCEDAGTVKNEITVIHRLDPDGMTVDELFEMASRYSAAAGDILKIIKEKKSSENL